MGYTLWLFNSLPWNIPQRKSPFLIGKPSINGPFSMSMLNYPLVMTNSLPWKDPPFLIGKPSINGPFSMSMLNYPLVMTNSLPWKITIFNR